MCRISDTAHVLVYLCKVTPPCHLHHKPSERISDTAHVPGSLRVHSVCYQRISDTLMGLVLFAGSATKGVFWLMCILVVVFCLELHYRLLGRVFYVF